MLFSRSDRRKGVDFHPTEPWLLSSDRPLQRHCQYPQPWNKGDSQNIWSRRSSSAFSNSSYPRIGSSLARMISNYGCPITTTPMKISLRLKLTLDVWRYIPPRPMYWLEVMICRSKLGIGKNIRVSARKGLSLFLLNFMNEHPKAVHFNRKDTITFLSVCLDSTIKMWSLGSSTPNFSIEAHEKSVKYADFYPGADKPYLDATGDDKIIKAGIISARVACKQWKVILGHTNNVSFAVFHPDLPINLIIEPGVKMAKWVASSTLPPIWYATLLVPSVTLSVLSIRKRLCSRSSSLH